VGERLDGLEQAAAAHVADERMIAEPLVEAAGQMRALCLHVGEELVAADHLLHRERGRASERMTHESMAVLERAGACRHRFEYLFPDQERADRRVAAAQSLGDRHHVRAHTLLPPRLPPPPPPPTP